MFRVLARIQGNDLDKQALSCNERCQMINLNSVVVAKQLKHSSLMLN